MLSSLESGPVSRGMAVLDPLGFIRSRMFAFVLAAREARGPGAEAGGRDYE